MIEGVESLEWFGSHSDFAWPARHFEEINVSRILVHVPTHFPEKHKRPSIPSFLLVRARMDRDVGRSPRVLFIWFCPSLALTMTHILQAFAQIVKLSANAQIALPRS